MKKLFVILFAATFLMIGFQSCKDASSDPKKVNLVLDEGSKMEYEVDGETWTITFGESYQSIQTKLGVPEYKANYSVDYFGTRIFLDQTDRVDYIYILPLNTEHLGFVVESVRTKKKGALMGDSRNTIHTKYDNADPEYWDRFRFVGEEGGVQDPNEEVWMEFGVRFSYINEQVDKMWLIKREL